MIFIRLSLSSEQEILREEVNSLQTVRNRLQSRFAFLHSCTHPPSTHQFRLTEVEEEFRKTREELEKKKEEEVSLARNHFYSFARTSNLDLKNSLVLGI